MTDDKPQDVQQRLAHRAPISVKVNLEFEKFSGFISEYSMNISEGGMFIKTDSPKPVGTILSFEFRLSDNFKLIQGLGEVTWVRDQSLSAEQPKGMGIRFHEIDSKSKELIRTMVARHVREGGKPFEIGLPSLNASSGVSALKNLFDVPTEELGAAPLIHPAPPSPRLPESLTSGTSTTEIDAGGGVEEDFRALFQADESPTTAPPPREGPSIAEVEHENARFKDIGIVIDDETISTTDNTLTSRLEPEEELPSPRKTRRRLPSGFWQWLILPPTAVFILGAAGWFFFPQEFSRILGKKADVRVAAKSSVAPKSEAPVTTPVPAATTAPVLKATAAPAPTAAPTPAPTMAPTAIPLPPKKPAAKAAPVRLGKLTTVTQVVWKISAKETVITLRGNGEFTEESFEQFRIDAHPPRELLKIHGIQHGYKPATMSPKSPHVKQIRTGFHSNAAGDELHFVFDLATPKARLTHIEPNGPNLVAHFSNQ